MLIKYEQIFEFVNSKDLYNDISIIKTYLNIEKETNFEIIKYVKEIAIEYTNQEYTLYSNKIGWVIYSIYSELGRIPKYQAKFIKEW